MYDNDIYSDVTFSAVPAGGDQGGKNSGNPKQKGGIFRKWMLSISLGLCFGLFAGIGFYAVQLGLGQTAQKEQEQLQEKEQDQGKEINNSLVYSDEDGVVPANTWAGSTIYVSADVSDVVEEVMPAMVSIINNYVQTGTSIWGQTYTDHGKASGSGIIVSKNDTELLIVTNNHVVEDTEALEVNFINGTMTEAVVKGLDSEMDLAVIAVSLSELDQDTLDAINIATLGDSDALKLGEPVIAIGNALGYGQSVTTGIVSALDREISFSDGSKGNFIQTDAAINPGNSGGALLNINGEVIGINSSKIGGTTVEGMGYAIPITSASPIIADLMERQTRTVKVAEEEMGYLGITLETVTEQISQAYGMPRGVFIRSVEPGLAAAQAGLIKGDIIVEFDGQRIFNANDLLGCLQYYVADETVTVTVQRVVNGEYEARDFEVTLGQRPAR